MPSRWWTNVRYTLRHRTRQVVLVLLLTISAGLLVLLAWRMSRTGTTYLGELTLEVGAGLAITLSTYVVLNPLFKELRATRIAEHPRLDRESLLENVRRSKQTVSILETWTDMLEDTYRDRFLEAIGTALRNHATVRILLLDPDSPGVDLRTLELRNKRDVQQAVLANLRHLVDLRERLGDEHRERLRVRTYVASPSVQMYRWDDKAYISFFPLDQSNFDVPQIETFMSTPLGEFVRRRFEELWTDETTRDLARLGTLNVRAKHGTEDLGLCEVQFVALDSIHFVTGAPLHRHIVKHGIGTLHAELDGSGLAYRMLEADDLASKVYERVLALFDAKYGPDNARFIVALLPPDRDADQVGY